MRWFDKLARLLQGRARITVVESTIHKPDLHNMHGILGI
jgi:hypothetical protein